MTMFALTRIHSGVKGKAHRLLVSRCCLSSATVPDYAVQDEESSSSSTPLLELRDAVLAFPSSSSATPATTRVNLSIPPPDRGGHVVLGRNGAGKSLLSNSLLDPEDYLLEGSLETDGGLWHRRSIARVSFESHQELLRMGGTVYKAISGGGNLSKASQFLVVRFGLFPLLHRDVDTLSTGEIRKVLIIRALSDRPRLLVLDNAFDGLDVASRDNLKDLVSKTMRGFRPDILVQGVSAKDAAHTQVLLMTHRSEEMVDEIDTVSYFEKLGKDHHVLKTEVRDGRSGAEIMLCALDMDRPVGDGDPDQGHSDLPGEAEISAWWSLGRQSIEGNDDLKPVVEARDLSVRRGGALILQGLDWTVRPGQHWLVAGGNGAGKSTLSRLLVSRPDTSVQEGLLNVDKGGNVSGAVVGVGWVSTELHMAMAASTKSAADVLRMDGLTHAGISETMVRWLGLHGGGDDDDESVSDILSRPFAALSQGQQKLILIGSALASRPRLLVLDEPCQGLDLVHRQRVLGLCERLCRYSVSNSNTSDMSLIYITHHMEELLPSVRHVLHLSEGQAVYCGSVADYDPGQF